MARLQQDVVEREGFAKALDSLRHRQLLFYGHPAAMSSGDEHRRRQNLVFRRRIEAHRWG
jgi:hypothetical protein